MGLASTRDGRGVAVADFDNDGRLDLFVANANGLPFLYRNRLPAGLAWVELVLHGSGSNTAAVGARAAGSPRAAAPSSDSSTGGNGFAAQGTPRVHVGLAGAATDRSRRYPLALGRQPDSHRSRHQPHL